MVFVQRRAESLATSNGVSNRAAWKASARNGNQVAIRKLQWPRYPTTLAYLDDLHAEWSLGRGDSPNGIAPATWAEVESWARVTGKQLKPREIVGLVQLDRVFVSALRGANEPRTPETNASEGDATPTAVVPAWPTKKAEG